MEWFNETLHKSWRQSLTMDKVLYHEKTEHQDLIVFENAHFGTVLALDGIVQTTTGDEQAYHEMLAHPAILAHGRARSVLIVGGGDGGTLREVVKHEAVQRIVEAELDPAVIEFCKKYLPTLSDGAYDDSRLEVTYGDAALYMKHAQETFDIILVDSTDPIGPGASLFTTDFYEDCRKRLNEGGILVTQCGVPALQARELTVCQNRQKEAGFEDVDFYLTVVPTYVGGFMALGWASDDPTRRRVRADTLHGRIIPENLSYYNPEIHISAFSHPNWLKTLVEKFVTQPTQ